MKRTREDDEFIAADDEIEIVLPFEETTFVRIDGELMSLATHGPFATGDALRNTIPRIGGGVSVRPSTLDVTAGNGLFADRDFEEGEIITYYDGQMIRYRQFRDVPRKWLSHARAVYHYKYALIGNYGEYRTPRPGYGGLAYANTLFAGDTTHSFNATFEQIDTMASMTYEDPFNRVIVAKALERIPAGSEIFIDYGRFHTMGGDINDGDDDEGKGLDLVRPSDFVPRGSTESAPKKRRIELTPLRLMLEEGGDLPCYQCGEPAMCHLAQRLFCSHVCLFNYSLDESNGFPPHEVVIALTEA